MDRSEFADRQRNLTLASRAVMEAVVGCKQNQKQVLALRTETLRNLKKLKQAIELERLLQCQNNKTSEKLEPEKSLPNYGFKTSYLDSIGRIK